MAPMPKRHEWYGRGVREELRWCPLRLVFPLAMLLLLVLMMGRFMIFDVTGTHSVVVLEERPEPAHPVELILSTSKKYKSPMAAVRDYKSDPVEAVLEENPDPAHPVELTFGDSGKHKSLVVAVHGHNSDRIEAVRDTWMSQYKETRVRCTDGGTYSIDDMHMFVYKCKGPNCDIIAETPSTTAINPSLSSLERTLFMFRHMYTEHPDSSYILKIDDDAWFNGTQMLRQLCTHQDPYMGFLMEAGKQRFASGGAGYLLSTELFRKHPEILGGGCGSFKYEDLGLAKCLSRIANGLQPSEMPGMYPDTPEKMLSWAYKPSSDHRSRFRMGVEPITFHYIPAERNRIMADSQRKIPKRLHMIWIGSKYPPIKSMIACSKVHSDFELFVWTTESVKNIKFDSKYQKLLFVLQKLEDVYSKHNQAGAKKLINSNDILYWTDLVRMEILYLFGGIYMDADSVCLRSMAPLLDQSDAFAVLENEKIVPGMIANGIMGFRQYSALAFEYLQQVLELVIDSHDAWASTGPCLLSWQLVYRENPEEWSKRGKKTKLCKSPIKKTLPPPVPTNESLKIYPSKRFYPYHHKQKLTRRVCKQALDADPFTFQLWGSSHKSYTKNSKHRDVQKDLEALRVAHGTDEYPDFGIELFNFSDSTVACNKIVQDSRTAKKSASSGSTANLYRGELDAIKQSHQSTTGLLETFARVIDDKNTEIRDMEAKLKRYREKETVERAKKQRTKNLFETNHRLKLKVDGDTERRVWGIHQSDDGWVDVVMVEGHDSKYSALSLHDLYIRSDDEPWLKAYLSSHEIFDSLEVPEQIESFYVELRENPSGANDRVDKGFNPNKFQLVNDKGEVEHDLSWLEPGVAMTSHN